MRRVFVGLASLALVAGCPNSKPADATTPDDGLPHPLSEADRKALDAVEGVYALLPEGLKTPVHLLRGTDGTPCGLWFAVRSEVASLTVHGMRRGVARAVQAAAMVDGGAPDQAVDEDGQTLVTPFVYLAGPSGDGRVRVAVLTRDKAGLSLLTRDDAQDAALEGEGPPLELVDATALAGFLRRWSEKTGVTLLSVARDHVELELDQLPPEENQFLDELSQFTGEPSPDGSDLLPRPIHELRDALGRSRHLTLP